MRINYCVGQLGIGIAIVRCRVIVIPRGRICRYGNEPVSNFSTDTENDITVQSLKLDLITSVEPPAGNDGFSWWSQPTSWTWWWGEC